MRILLVNNHHQNLGGTERYYFELAKLLRGKGHQVAFFSTLDEKTQKNKWQKYFVEKINFSTIGRWNLIKLIPKIIYSLESRKNIKFLLEDFKPDLVHVQNIYYYISPSILPEIKKRKIPIVQTVHDYQLISPIFGLFHHGNICEVTRKHKYYKTVFHRCVEDSYLASILSVLNSYLQHYFQLYERNVDCFITPSLFVKYKLEEYGFRGKQIVHLPNFLDIQNIASEERVGEFVLCFGALRDHKGMNLIVDAAKKLPGIYFKIAGDGPDEKKLKRQAKSARLENIEFTGFLSKKRLENQIRSAAFCVVPSLWYENMPYSILEPFSLGKTVIASNTGGIPEIIDDKKNGLLFNIGELPDLVEKIKFLWNDKKLCRELGQNARKKVIKKYSPPEHYRGLLKIYNNVLKD